MALIFTIKLIVAIIIGKSVNNYYGKSQNPVKYINT